MITAIVLAKNEDETIERCIKSLMWCDEIILIDDYSIDQTIPIAEKYTSFIYKRKLNGDYSAQRNYGMEKAHGEWVLFVDADEWVGEGLKKEIKIAVSGNRNKNIDGFYLRRNDFFLGEWLRYGETGDVCLLRLARKGRGIWTGRVHEVWDIKGNTKKLSCPLFHHSHTSVAGFLKKINNYSDITAWERREKGATVSAVSIIFFPLGKFMRNYFFKKGFLDGMPGLIMALMMSFHSFLVRSKMYLIPDKNKNS